MQQLSVYLDVADAVTLPQGWSRQAHFSLTVQNQKDPPKSVAKGAHRGLGLTALTPPEPLLPCEHAARRNQAGALNA